MTDVFTKAKRSAVMSRIRSSGNKDTELRLIEIFKVRGITGWRRGYTMVGKPDFVFAKIRLAVFVDGCFWHACPKHFRLPQSRTEFWTQKISRNQDRDRLVNRTLRKNGWKVVRIWEHALVPQKTEVTVAAFRRLIEKRALEITAMPERLLRSRRAPTPDSQHL
ncbi:MAG: DNA mismatch endonuclease Vsr [Opitutaceae bacterium]|nr:DNA mismatch endonuclease Vsr [Opitutaceae bacterium]